MTAPHARLRSALRRFRRDCRGTVTTEAVIVLPMILFVLIMTVVFSDMFRARATSQKAAYTIADTLSRQTDPVPGAYIDGLNELYAYLSRARQLTGLRVSSVAWDPADEEYMVIWSHPAGGGPALSQADLVSLHKARLPTMPAGETIILVEANMNYTPMLTGYFPPLDLNTAIVTRPRFTPQLRFDTGEEIIFLPGGSGTCDDGDDLCGGGV